LGNRLIELDQPKVEPPVTRGTDRSATELRLQRDRAGLEAARCSRLDLTRVRIESLSGPLLPPHRAFHRTGHTERKSPTVRSASRGRHHWASQ
jgi:hypothetical protein